MPPIILHEKRTCECSSNFDLNLIPPSDDDVEVICSSLVLKQEDLKRIMEVVSEEINRKYLPRKSLSCTKRKINDVFIKKLPSGDERGKYLVLDVPDRKFRVACVELCDKKMVNIKSEDFICSKELLCGKVENLFDYFAECIAVFLKRANLEGEFTLAFTFLKYLKIVSTLNGYLQMWSKNFVCNGLFTTNVVELLSEALDKRTDIKVKVVVILNDSTGCLMSRAWKYPSCKIGVVNSDICRVAFLDRIEIKTERKGDVNCYEDDSTRVEYNLLDLNLGLLGDDGCLESIQNQVDREVDKCSLDPGKYIFEKMASSRTIGELVRIALVHLANYQIIFMNKSYEHLMIKGRFPTSHVYVIESDEEKHEYVMIRSIFRSYGIKYLNDCECNDIKYICQCVSRRSAHMLAAGIAAILNRINEGPRIIISVDGEMYRYHPYYHHYLKNKIKELVEPNVKFELVLAKDSRGVGAAIAAAVVCSIENDENKLDGNEDGTENKVII